MDSPTSNIITSIKALKSKLQGDRERLDYLKKDFSTKALPQIPERPSLNEYKSNTSVDRSMAQKITALRKSHQQEIQKLKECHEKQMSELKAMYEQTIEEQKQNYEKQVEEQQTYMRVLEEQLNNTQRTSKDKCEESQKYEQIINQLLNENTMLMEKVSELKGQKSPIVNSRSRAKIFVNNKNRLKFSKAVRKDDSENYDTTNWDDDFIMTEETKIRTIKHLVKGFN